MSTATVTVATIVKNEADRFLLSAVRSWTNFADRIVAIDDGSTDASAKILTDAGAKVYSEEFGLFGNEWKARKRLWDLARDGSEWVVWLDADQTLSCDPRPYLHGSTAAFRVYDLWSPTEYRDDAWWTGHKRCWWYAVHIPSLPKGFKDEWNQRGMHTGHVPINIRGVPHPIPRECSVLHYAYSTPELREQKHAAYMAVSDNHLTQKERFHAQTILTPRAHTKPLPFEPAWPLTLAA